MEPTFLVKRKCCIVLWIDTKPYLFASESFCDCSHFDHGLCTNSLITKNLIYANLINKENFTFYMARHLIFANSDKYIADDMIIKLCNEQLPLHYCIVKTCFRLHFICRFVDVRTQPNVHTMNLGREQIDSRTFIGACKFQH